MGRRQNDPGGCSFTRRRSRWALFFAVVLGCSLAYAGLTSALRRPSTVESSVGLEADGSGGGGGGGGEERKCCRGVENLELWGAVVAWGIDHRVNSAKECCEACKVRCPTPSGKCLCDSWVFCGNEDRCREKFGECWLKKQNDVMSPAISARGEKVIWTSGLIFGEGEGIIKLETDHGALRVKLHPECAPHSVAYITELLGSRHCAGCQIYRAEDQGHHWDSNGDHITDAPFGPPYALLQGTLEADGVPYKKMPVEACPRIRRGSVAWVGLGPEFFVSLANHYEWRKEYTVFGTVVPEDMLIAEKIARLPTKPDVWSNVTVSLLEEPVHFKVRHSTGLSGNSSAASV